MSDDIFYTDAPIIDAGPYIWPGETPTRLRRRLRNWHRFVLIVGATQIAGAFLLYRLTTSLMVVGLGLSVWLVVDLLGLFLAWKMERL